jgi:hypothetical protein
MTARLQLELLDDRPPLSGLRVRLETRARCKCGSDIAVISCRRGPHAAELTCARCGAYRGGLSHNTANWITTVIGKFGAPTTPIVLRRR